MTVEPLKAEDVALLCAEPHGAQLQIGALCFFEAAPLRDDHGRLRIAELRGHVESRLGALPRFRQRIAPVFADVSAPVWVDDTEFDIARHTRHVKLGAADGHAALRTFVARLLEEPMDLAHPLWDIHTIELTDPDVVAIVVRAHHVMADGLALHEAATLLLDAAPRPPAKPAHEWSPEHPAGELRRTAVSLADRTCRQTSLAARIGRALFDPRRLVPNARIAAHLGSAARRGGLPRARKLPITRPVGTRRAFVWDSLPMDDVITLKRACGVTVNDVVLAIVTGALRRELQATGAGSPGEPEPRALVPIGGHDHAELALGNRFTITTVGLPVAVDDPLERTRLIHARMHRSGASRSQSIMPYVFSIADVVPLPALRAVVPGVLARQPLVNLAVTNIPGSRDPLYLWGARLLGMYPFITGVGNIALIVGVLSYGHELGVGITVDPEIVDPQIVLDHVRDAMDELTSCIR